MKASVPPVPADYLPRPDVEADIRAMLLRTVGAMSLTAGFDGPAAGAGKTTLAKVMCNDSEVRRHFSDGVLWLPVGRERTGDEVMKSLAEKMAIHVDGNGSLLPAMQARIAGRRLLVVLDDIWFSEQVAAFVALDAGISGLLVLLLTTRNAQLAATYGESMRLQQLSEMASLRMLTNFLGRGVKLGGGEDSEALLRACRGNVAMLRSVANLCRKRGVHGAVRHLEDCRARQIAATLPDASEYGTLYAALEGTLSHLSPELARRAAMLAVFPEDCSVPLSVVGQLWGLPTADLPTAAGLHTAEDLHAGVASLEACQLIDVDWSQNCLTMIDLHRDYLRCRGKSELAIWHGELLRGCKRSAIGVEVGHVTDSYWCPGRRWVYHASEGAAFAIDAVKATLTSISLPATALQPEDGTVLATMVRGCTALTSLDVGFNNLDERGVLELVRAARQRDQMVSLGFASCKIGTQGAKEIATYVATCAALASLNLEYNCIDPEGAMALADALSGDPTLTKLNLSEMNRSPEDRDDMGGILAISSALKTNRHLTYLNLSTNNIDVRAGTALAGAVAINGVLKHIDLTSNRLCGISSHAGRQVGRYDAAAVRALARTLETNLSLTSCDLRFNHIEDAEKQALRSACGSRVPDAFLKSLCLKM